MVVTEAWQGCVPHAEWHSAHGCQQIGQPGALSLEKWLTQSSRPVTSITQTNRTPGPQPAGSEGQLPICLQHSRLCQGPAAEMLHPVGSHTTEAVNALQEQVCVGTALSVPCSHLVLEQMAKFHHYLCILLLYFPWTSQTFCLLVKDPASST